MSYLHQSPDKVINLSGIITKTSLRAEGNSMAPLLIDGDRVFVKPVKMSALTGDDIVLVVKKGKYFIHRVIYKNRRYLITRGDNNLYSDGKISAKQIIGRVSKISRSGNQFTPEDLYMIQSGYYLREIVIINRLFNFKKVNFVFLKGLPLHFFYEGRHPRRLFYDCDILIDGRDLEKVHNVFLNSGYTLTETPLSDTQSRLRDKETERSYRKIHNGIPVNFDVHLEPAFLMTQLGRLEALYPQSLIVKYTQFLLQDKRRVTVDNEDFDILDPVRLIGYLALHFFHHNFQGAFRLEFINRVIRKKRMTVSDWRKLAETIRRFRMSGFVIPVFMLLQKHYATPVPDYFYEYLGAVKRNRYKKYLNTNIFDESTRISAGVNRFRNIFDLSPEPLLKKLTVFTDLQVIYAVYFTLKKNLDVFLRTRPVLRGFYQKTGPRIR